MKTLIELQNERDELTKQRNKIQTEIDKLIKAVSLQEYKKKYENTYWKTPNDEGRRKQSYRYYHVKTVKDICEIDGIIRCLLICNVFEAQSDGTIYIGRNSNCFTNVLETKITLSEYKKAKSAAIKTLLES